jgi:hypothetical protein
LENPRQGSLTVKRWYISWVYEDDDRRVHDEMEAEGRDHCEPTPEELGCTPADMDEYRKTVPHVCHWAVIDGYSKHELYCRNDKCDHHGKLCQTPCKWFMFKTTADDNIKDIRDLKAAVAKHATMIADNKRYVERLISLIEDLGKIVEHQKQCINSHNADIIALQIKTD